MSRKTGREAKVERMTWFALVMVFVLLRFDRDVSIPDYIVPFIISAILLISGVYQYTQHWRISPLTWGFAFALLVSALIGIYYETLIPIDLILVSLIAVVIIIVVGVITNEG